MNDRYLFRGFKSTPSISGHKWFVKGFLSYDVLENVFRITDECGFVHDVDEKTIGQCTGHKDKNGELIFGGDKLFVIDIREKFTTNYEGVVVFEDFMWILKNDECDTYLCYYLENNCCAATEIEITGNIHEQQSSD